MVVGSGSQRTGVEVRQGESDSMRKHEANKRSNSSSNNNNDKTTDASPLSAKKNKTVVTTTTAAPLADFTLAPSGWDARKFESCEGLGEKALTVPPLLTPEGIYAFEVPPTFFKNLYLSPPKIIIFHFLFLCISLTKVFYLT